LKAANNRIVFITQWQWKDPLVQIYTLPYVEIIQKITLCYPYVVTVNKSLNRVLIQKKKNFISLEVPSGKRFLFFGWVLNILNLQRIVKKKGIKIIHPWCTTAGVIGAVLKKWDSSLTLNIDSFEPHAEAMVENGTWKRSGLKYKALFYFEKMEAKIATHLVFAAQGMEKYIQEKYKWTVNNYFVKPACIDLSSFSGQFIKDREFLNKYKLEGKIVCIYAGKFGGIYLENETFEFIKNCEKYWGEDKFRFLLLSNVSDEYIKARNSKFNISNSTVIKLFVQHNEVPLYMGLADFAICPVKPVPTKRYCTPIKDGEYWAMGLPVVIPPNISVDSEIIKENSAGAILESFDDEGYTNAIRQIDSIIKDKSRVEIYNQIRPLAEKYRSFIIAEKIYQKIYG